MAILPTTKTGDTFAFIATIKDEAGVPIVGKAHLLKSQVRNYKDELIAELIISETETPGNYLFKALDTADWPLNEELRTDIQYTDNEIVTSSETIMIPMAKDVTR